VDVLLLKLVRREPDGSVDGAERHAAESVEDGVAWYCCDESLDSGTRVTVTRRWMPGEMPLLCADDCAGCCSCVLVLVPYARTGPCRDASDAAAMPLRAALADGTVGRSALDVVEPAATVAPVLAVRIPYMLPSMEGLLTGVTDVGARRPAAGDAARLTLPFARLCEEDVGLGAPTSELARADFVCESRATSPLRPRTRDGLNAGMRPTGPPTVYCRDAAADELA
jgi:hypothetical protein